MATIEKEKAIDVVRQMVADGQVSQEVAEKYFPELKESKDERIRQLLLRFVEYDMPDNYSDDFSKEDCLDWIEKHGDQPKEVTYTHEVETGNGNIKALVTEKVQLTKFKVGDWVVYECGEETATLQIARIVGKTYVFSDGTTLSVADEDTLRLWDITKDAQKGE